MFSERGKERGLGLTASCRVVALIDGWKNVVILLGNSNHIFDFVGAEVGEAKTLEGT